MRLVAIVITAAALLGVHSCAQAQPQSDDIAFARAPSGVTLSLSSQQCPMAGFYWYHIDDAKGRSLKTGCWSFATHRRVMVMDGQGGVDYMPYSRFSTNPAYGE